MLGHLSSSLQAPSTSIGKQEESVKKGSALSKMLDKKLDDQFNIFMKMFITQLQNQDPSSPMESMDMTNNLLMFFSAAEQAKTNHLLSQMNEHRLVEQALAAESYIGQDIERLGDQFTFNGTEQKITYTLKEDAKDGELIILTPQGQRVKGIPLETEKGQHTITWDGHSDKDLKMAPGIYKVKVIAKNPQEKDILVDTQFTGTISHFEIQEDGKPQFYAEGVPVRFDQILKVKGSLKSPQNSLRLSNSSINPLQIYNQIENLSNDQQL